MRKKLVDHWRSKKGSRESKGIKWLGNEGKAMMVLDDVRVILFAPVRKKENGSVWITETAGQKKSTMLNARLRRLSPSAWEMIQSL